MANTTTPAAAVIEELQKACLYTDAALDALDHVKAPIDSSKIIVQELLSYAELPDAVRTRLRAIHSSMSLARCLLESELEELDAACTGWANTLDTINGSAKK